MLDLFTVLVPLFSGLALLTLLALKLAIKDNVTLIRILSKNQDAYQIKNEQTEESPVKNILKYLLLNFTPIEICAVRRAKHKLSLFLSLAIILIGTSFVSSPFAFAATGTLVYFLYFFLSLKMTFNGEAETEENKKYRQKYLQIVFAVLTLVLNFIMIARVYKNYHNTTLTVFLANAGISIVLDNFLVRPMMVVLIGLPLSKSSLIQGYISECQKQIVLLETYDVIGEKEMLLRPKKMFSPSKIPKSIPLDFEIEPRPFQEPNRNESYDKPYDLLRKIKKEKLLPPITLNLQSMDDHSLNSLLNSTKKQEHQCDDFVLDPPTDKVENVESEETEFPMKKKVVSENMIMINPSQNEPIENEEDIECHNIQQEKEEPEQGQNEDEYGLKGSRRGATFNVGDYRGEPLKISLNYSDHPTSRQQPLRIQLNKDLNLGLEEDQSEEDDDIDNFKRRKELMTIEDANKNPFGVLEVKEESNQGEEIEEIDFNSPERRRRMQLHVEQEQDFKVLKKKKKKIPHPNQRIIKHSTGEPYLEYMPAMLERAAHNKKSQSLSRKHGITDSRIVNSVKRPNKKRIHAENNENIVPFRIEDL